MFPKVVSLCQETRARGGNIVIEWPAYNDYWRKPEVVALVKKYGLSDVLFHGCAVGLKSANGKPIKKPWRLVTDIPEVVDSFRPCQCTHNKEDHDICKGKEAERSAAYTTIMAKKFHRAFAKHISASPREFVLIRYHKPYVPRSNDRSADGCVTNVPVAPLWSSGTL